MELQAKSWTTTKGREMIHVPGAPTGLIGNPLELRAADLIGVATFCV